MVAVVVCSFTLRQSSIITVAYKQNIYWASCIVERKSYHVITTVNIKKIIVVLLCSLGVWLHSVYWLY